MNSQRRHLQAIVALTAVIFGAWMFWLGYGTASQEATNKLIVDGLLHVMSVAGTVGIFVWLFDRWLWKWPLINPLFGSRPNLNGTWRAELVDLTDPSKTNKPFPAVMVIRQTYLATSMRLHTRDSQSRLRLSEIVHNPDGTYSFLAIYIATPHITPRRKGLAFIHRGCMMLSIHTKPRPNIFSRAHVDCMKGEWWTDRGTVGSIELVGCLLETFDDYGAANAAFPPSVPRMDPPAQVVADTVGAA